MVKCENLVDTGLPGRPCRGQARGCRVFRAAGPVSAAGRVDIEWTRSGASGPAGRTLHGSTGSNYGHLSGRVVDQKRIRRKSQRNEQREKLCSLLNVSEMGGAWRDVPLT